jgi:hypothetical protein
MSLNVPHFSPCGSLRTYLDVLSVLLASFGNTTATPMKTSTKTTIKLYRIVIDQKRNFVLRHCRSQLLNSLVVEGVASNGLK